ncbi:MAG: cyclopropane-fatty-acyl-phospholipid synthase family protein [Gemmatimonadetes bacterium]|nr:cyclopropane-fatty-acyl-phospholipid synthase family protein [Gemmatimonadota bacterium]
MSAGDLAAAAPPRAGITERAAQATLLSGLGGLRRGTLGVRTPGGTTHTFAGELEGPAATIDVADPGFFRRMLLDGELGAGESYIRGEWASDSLVDVIRLGIQNRTYLKRGSPLFWVGAIGAWLAHQLRTNTRPRAKENISAHYDLGNDFFELFLDPSMTYSCAYFDELESALNVAPDVETLEEAQRAKYRRIADQAGVRPGDHVLEIGCGWGGFAELAALEYDCRVTGVTISEEQHRYALRRVEAAGVADRVEIRLADYRSLEGSFDRIVSIEMLEAVGHHFLPTFFRACDELLAPGGKAAIQAISIPHERYFRYRLRPDYIQKFIFPGAHLPSLVAMRRAMRGTRLGIVEKEDLAEHYAPTLAAWRQRLLARRDEVNGLGFDDAFVRRWEFYFAYCEAAFRERYVADYQLVLSREDAS